MSEYPILEVVRTNSRYFNAAIDLYNLLRAMGEDVESSDRVVGGFDVKFLTCDGIKIRCCNTANGTTEIAAKIDSDKSRGIWESIKSSGKFEFDNMTQTQKKIEALDDFSPTLKKHGKTIEEVKDYILRAVRNGVVPENLRTVTVRQFAMNYFPDEVEIVIETFRQQFEKKKRNENELGDFDSKVVVIENIISPQSIRKWMKEEEKKSE